MKKQSIYVKRIFSITLAVLLIIGGALASPVRVNAAQPYGGNGEMPKVPYRYNGGHSYEVQDPEWVHVYCADPSKGYSSSGTNEDFRWKFDLKALPTLIDYNKQGLNGGSESSRGTSAQIDKLVSILWYAEQLEADVEETQSAVWYFITQGAVDEYATNTSQYNNYVVKAAGDSGWAKPENYNLWMYLPDTEAASSTLQWSVRLETSDTPAEPPTPPTPPEWNLSTTVVVGDQIGAKDKPVTIQLEKGQEKATGLTIEDRIQYSNMAGEAGHNIWVMLSIMDENGEVVLHRDTDDNGDPIFNAGGWTVADAGEGEWGGDNLTKWGVELEPGTYYMAVTVRDADTGQQMRLDDANDTAEQIVVRPAEAPKPTVSNTTVHGTKEGSTEELTGTINVQEGETITLTDKVTVENLEEGKTYTLTSQLYKDGVEFGEAEVTEVKSTDTFPIDVTFSTKITESGKYTIKAVLSLDGTELSVHNGTLDDAAETVTVTVTKPEPPTPTEPEPTKPAEPTTPTQSTPTNPAPATGDNNNIMLWVFIALIACLAAAVSLRVRQRRK